MNELLKFIIAHLSFLWTGERFRIEEGFGNQGDALVRVASEVIRVEVVRDRGQFLILVRPTVSEACRDGYPLSLICRLIGGTQCDLLSCLDPAREAAFLEANIDAIELAFSERRWDYSRPLLEQFRREQQRRMFGDSRPVE